MRVSIPAERMVPLRRATSEVCDLAGRGLSEVVCPTCHRLMRLTGTRTGETPGPRLVGLEPVVVVEFVGPCGCQLAFRFRGDQLVVRQGGECLWWPLDFSDPDTVEE